MNGKRRKITFRFLTFTENINFSLKKNASWHLPEQKKIMKLQGVFVSPSYNFLK